MIKKCDKPGCTKAGTCRAPKSRDLKDYWFFCQEHAAEYNKNWNFYADMSPEEIEADWERQTFGAPLKDTDTANKEATDYTQFLNDFLHGRSKFDRIPAKNKLPTTVVSALKVFGLGISATWREVGTKYRAMAKQYHPDTATDKKNAATEFARISAAYDILKKHFGKK